MNLKSDILRRDKECDWNNVTKKHIAESPDRIASAVTHKAMITFMHIPPYLYKAHELHPQWLIAIVKAKWIMTASRESPAPFSETDRSCLRMWSNLIDDQHNQKDMQAIDVIAFYVTSDDSCFLYITTLYLYIKVFENSHKIPIDSDSCRITIWLFYGSHSCSFDYSVLLPTNRGIIPEILIINCCDRNQKKKQQRREKTAPSVIIYPRN